MFSNAFTCLVVRAISVAKPADAELHRAQIQQPLQLLLVGQRDGVEVGRGQGRGPTAGARVAAYRIVAKIEHTNARHGPGPHVDADTGRGGQGTRLERLRTAHRNGLVEALPGFDREPPKLVQSVQELGLVVTELTHQRRPLVLEQISTLRDEDSTTATSRATHCGWRQGTAWHSPGRSIAYFSLCRCATQTSRDQVGDVRIALVADDGQAVPGTDGWCEASACKARSTRRRGGQLACAPLCDSLLVGMERSVPGTATRRDEHRPRRALDHQHAPESSLDTPWLVTGVIGSVSLLEVLVLAEPDLRVPNGYDGTSFIRARERGRVGYVSRVLETRIEGDRVTDSATGGRLGSREWFFSIESRWRERSCWPHRCGRTTATGTRHVAARPGSLIPAAIPGSRNGPVSRPRSVRRCWTLQPGPGRSGPRSA